MINQERNVFADVNNIDAGGTTTREHQQSRNRCARTCCTVLTLPCTSLTCLISAPYLASQYLYPADSYAQEACGKLLCPCKCVMYPLFCCCVAVPTMAFDSPDMDPYSSLNMFCVSRCPGLLWIGCTYLHVPMDLRFMKED